MTGTALAPHDNGIPEQIACGNCGEPLCGCTDAAWARRSPPSPGTTRRRGRADAHAVASLSGRSG